jgi:phosphopantetheinyl transferase
MPSIQDINLHPDVIIKMTEIQRTASTDTASERTTRRHDEKQAVLSLVHALFGELATIGHEGDGSPFIIPNQACLDPDVERVLAGRAPFISISHSRTHAALAVAPYRVGIDLESYRSALQHVAHRFLSPEEQAVYSVSHESLLFAWTAKEALYKAAGIPRIDFATQIILSGEMTAHVIARPFSLFTDTVSHQTITLAIPRD